MSKSNNLSNKVRHSAASAKSLSRSHEQDNLDTHEYLSLIASLHKEWDRLEAMGSTSVMPRPRSIMDAIIAETRHGTQVEMPDTDLGPYSMSEFSLRALIRRIVDSVPGARSLRSSFEHAPSSEEHRGLGFRRVYLAESRRMLPLKAYRSWPSKCVMPSAKPAMRTWESPRRSTYISRIFIMTTNFSAAELLRLVTAIPGVRGIEPGLGSTLKVIGSRMPQARFGVIIESGSRQATIEVSIDGSRPVKDIVRDIQETVIHSLSQSQQYDEEHTNSKTLDSTGSDNDNTPQVRVRVQSLL